MVGVKQLEDDNLLAKCANAIPKQSKLPQFLDGLDKDYFDYLLHLFHCLHLCDALEL